MDEELEQKRRELGDVRVSLEKLRLEKESVRRPVFTPVQLSYLTDASTARAGRRGTEARAEARTSAPGRRASGEH